MNEWISVEDRLPDKNGKYRIKGTTGAFKDGSFDTVAIFKIRPTGGIFMFGFDWQKITHWMPLPEQP